MAERLENRIAKLKELNNTKEKIATLAEIKIELGGLNNRDAENISRNYGSVFSILISQLTSTDSELLETACDALKTLFTILDPGDLYEAHRAEVLKLMDHPEEGVRGVIMQEILNVASNPQKVCVLQNDINFLVAVATKIEDDCLSVAGLAISIMKEIGKNLNGLQLLYKGELLRTFAKLLSKNDIVRFRVYDVAVGVAKSSKQGLEASIESGFLNSLINILENEDILLQLNALEAMTQLATTEEGLNFLEDQDVLKKLGQKIVQADENPLSNLLIPGLMKFFGNVARYWPNKIFSTYPAVVFALFEVIESGDQALIGVAMDTLGHVASTVEGKYALQELGDTMSNALKRLGEVIEKMPTDLRIRGLNNLVLILDVKPEEQDNRILSLTKSWFDSLSEKPLELLVSLCRHPFADIKRASLEVLATIALQTWGQEYISTFPGLTEFLLDRNIEAFKECKEAKYEVVKRLLESKANIFDAMTMQRFREFVQQGPFYVDVATEVAIEGAM